MKVSKKH